MGVATVIALGASGRAWAQDASAAPADPLPPGASIDLEKDVSASSLDAPVTEAPPEAPPPPPYRKTVVLDSSLGAMRFLGKFGDTAPTAPWIRTQIGYEIFRWLMPFAEGELGFSDTSGTQDPPKTRAFPMFGFGGGLRFSLRFTDRFGAYLQGSLGAMQADIRKNALTIIGFKKAESLGLYAGGRLGVEYYMMDRHFALGASAGLRDATGFKQQGTGSDTPLAFDAGLSVRYAF